MNFLKTFNQRLLNLYAFDFLVLLSFRLYLAYVFWFAGFRKIKWEDGFPNIDRFAGFLGPGGQDNLNFILPHFFGWLAVLSEAGGAILLLVGLFSRWIAIPLIFTTVSYTHLTLPTTVDV